MPPENKNCLVTFILKKCRTFSGNPLRNSRGVAFIYRSKNGNRKTLCKRYTHPLGNPLSFGLVGHGILGAGIFGMAGIYGGASVFDYDAYIERLGQF